VSTIDILVALGMGNCTLASLPGQLAKTTVDTVNQSQV